MKSILIFGEPRSGKSTLANLIVDKFHYQVIRMDALRDTFKKIYPELDIAPDRALINEKFQLFLQEYLRKNVNEERNCYGYVLEGCETTPETCHRLFQKENNLIYYLGPIDISSQDLFAEIRKHDLDKDWTADISDEDLWKEVDHFLKRAKNFKQECENYGITFIDTSHNREEKFQIILKEIEEKLKADKNCE